jgi:predicted small lipoprotein YifL
MKFLRVQLFFFLAVFILLAGCGKKGDPMPPEPVSQSHF